MIISVLFSALALMGVAYATWSSNMRSAILSLWLASLSIGAVYLTLGAEFLAIIQWIVSSVVAISLIFFSAMFGESSTDAELNHEKRTLKTAGAVAIGLGFLGLVVFSGITQEVAVDLGPSQGTDVFAIGKALIGKHLLALEVLTITLFVVIVGSGVIARPVAKKSAGGAV